MFRQYLGAALQLSDECHLQTETWEWSMILAIAIAMECNVPSFAWGKDAKRSLESHIEWMNKGNDVHPVYARFVFSQRHWALSCRITRSRVSCCFRKKENAYKQQKFIFNFVGANFHLIYSSIFPSHICIIKFVALVRWTVALLIIRIYMITLYNLCATKITGIYFYFA